MSLGERLGFEFDAARRDLRVAVRALAKSPAVTVVAVLSLALGIGANTAIFTVVQDALVRPLPYDEPERLVRLWELFEGASGQDRGAVSLPNLIDWRERTTTFDAMAGYDAGASFNLALDAADGLGAVRVQGTRATPQLFELLGVAPQLGSVFQVEDAAADSGGWEEATQFEVGEPKVVVLSDGLWRRHYGGDPEIVGRQIRMEGENYTVRGVMPPGFQFPPRSEDQLWVPLVVDPTLRERRGTHWLQVVARVAPEATLQQARAELRTVAEQLSQDYPNELRDRSATLEGLREATVGDRRSELLALAGAVALVFLIACANVSNLLLARFAARRREFALRSALGARRGQLIRQALMESLLLSVAAGAVGLLLAVAALRLLAQAAQSGAMSDSIASLAPAASSAATSATGTGISPSLVLICALATLLGGLACGLLPAWRSTRHLEREHVGGSAGRGTRAGRDRLRGALVMAEIALALVVLVGSLLMARSLLHLYQVDSGLQPENVLTLSLDLPASKYRPDETSNPARSFFVELTEVVSALPGVSEVGLINMLPMQAWGFNGNFRVAGYEPPSRREWPFAEFRIVDSDIFRALGVPMVEGEGFEANPPPEGELQVVVNQSLARRYWPENDAIGRRLGWSPAHDWRVVGVVGDVKTAGLDRDSQDVIYLHYAQMDRFPFPLFGMSLVVRSHVEPTALIASVREQVLQLDPEQPIFRVHTMEDVVDRHLAGRQFQTGLFGLFAGLALVLVIAGVYGVMAYSVEKRTAEMGLRMALGAQRRDVLQQILREGLSLALVGGAVGVVVALGLTRYLESQLFGIAATDPLTFLVTALLVLLVALLASLLPARRATRVDPVVALRSE